MPLELWVSICQPASQLFRQHLFQIVRRKTYAHNYAFRIDQKRSRYGFNVEFFGQGAVKIDGFHGVVTPNHAIVFHGAQPGIPAGLNANAENFKSFVVVFVVQLDEVWVFPPAWATPTSPKL